MTQYFLDKDLIAIEEAPTKIAKAMKEKGIIGENVPYDTIYIQAKGAGTFTIWWTENGESKTYDPLSGFVISEEIKPENPEETEGKVEE